MPASLTAPKILSLGHPSLTGSASVGLKAFRVLVGFAAADVLVDAQATYQLLSVPAGTVIEEILLRVITGFTASVTMTIGDGAAAAGFFASADIAPTVADTAGVFKSLKKTSSARSAGFKYLAADTIDAVIAGATPVAGLMEIIFIVADAPSGTT